MNDKVQYWIEISDYDIETASAMLETRRFLYVGFMCHQAIEKILKAFYQLIRDEIPPKTHNLRFLAKETGLSESLSETQKSFFRMLEPMNIDARYPEYKERIFDSLTYENCKEILSKTQEMQKWIKQKLLEKQKNI
ncbi:MAG: HEPN domain-containing protein [Candidatus Schekmanbacteria bacterium]|nr:HEPN domain-containing protein [Candidatus Schekmanbacteria bacterium]